MYLMIPATLDPVVFSASSIIEYQKQKIKFLGSRAGPASKADDLTSKDREIFMIK
jgi:hypothetical protein